MSEHPAHGGDDSADDPTGVHGMLLFGQDVLYMSHLPMFAHPHNFQVLLEVGFEETVHAALLSDRHIAGDGAYTFVPAPFSIVELVDRDAPRTSMSGSIFRGHFERGGTLIVEDVVAEVLRVVHFQELDITAARVDAQELTYLCFGPSAQLYVAHQISTRPDFDQIVAARLIKGTLTSQAKHPDARDVEAVEFKVGAQAMFRKRPDTPDGRLIPGEIAAAFFWRSVSPSGFHGFLVEMEIGRELYMETGELA